MFAIPSSVSYASNSTNTAGLTNNITNNYVVENGNEIKSPNSEEGSRTYTNKDYGLRLQYPSNWNASEINLLPRQIVFFYPTEIAESMGLFETEVPVNLAISLLPISPGYIGLNMSTLGSVFFSSVYDGNNTDIRLVNYSLPSLANGRPAVQAIYYDYSREKTFKRSDEISFYDYSNSTDSPSTELLGVTYSAEPGYYDKYLPAVTKMLDTLEIFSNSSGKSSLSAQSPIITNTTVSDDSLFGEDLFPFYSSCVDEAGKQVCDQLFGR